MVEKATLELVSDKPRQIVDQPYGDPTVLNTSRLIMDSVGKEFLTDIVHDYLCLLDSSAAIYEKNGDYALGIFSSGWCRLMDATSRNLCGTNDNREALAGGKWHCHESCWKTSKGSIDQGQPNDQPCLGGIRIYAVPIRANGEVVGSINFGYGSPPQDSDKLQEIAERYGLTVEEIRRQAAAYESRPEWLVDMAKARLATAAKLIGALIERKRAENTVREKTEELERFNRLAVGREKRMIELKRQVNELAQALGRPAPYDLSFAEHEGS